MNKRPAKLGSSRLISSFAAILSVALMTTGAGRDYTTKSPTMGFYSFGEEVIEFHDNGTYECLRPPNKHDFTLANMGQELYMLYVALCGKRLNR